MAKYIALHVLKKSAEDVSKTPNDGAVEMARAITLGETPCKCIES